MNIYSFAEKLLYGSNISDKLFQIENLQKEFVEFRNPIVVPKVPGREKRIKFSGKQLKFPKGEGLKQAEKMAQALHFFANHELMAIEMMAAAIIIYPTESIDDHNFKLGLISTIEDEQKHLNLYIKRINELGFEFGDFPVNDFFWKQMSSLKTPAQFYSLVALTFEAANLDFARYYQDLFKNIGDIKSANIMGVIYEDEIKHVSRGLVWLNKWNNQKTLWDYYFENLPELMTPARAKGIHFDVNGRKKAGLPDEFIEKVRDYRDDFSITDRKSWK